MTPNYFEFSLIEKCLEKMQRENYSDDICNWLSEEMKNKPEREECPKCNTTGGNNEINNEINATVTKRVFSFGDNDGNSENI